MRYLLFCLIFFISLTSTRGQELIWEKTIGGNDMEWLHHAFENSRGEYIFSGYTFSSVSGEITDFNRGVGDLWVLATNPAGTILWQRRFGGDHSDAIKKTIELSDGTYFLAGESQSGNSGDKAEPARGFRDLWLIKLDENRNSQWQKTLGGLEAEDLTDAVETNDGGFLIAANSRSSNTGDKTTLNLGETDIWILKLDSKGQIEWQKSYGGGDHDSNARIVKKNNGNFVIGASSASGVSATKKEPTRGIGDYWIFEIDPEGDILWQKTIGGNNGDHLESILATADGGYIVGGNSASGVSGEKTLPNNGSTDYWILKLNAVGNIQWQQVISGNDTDWLASISISKKSGYILGGMSYSGVGGDKTEPNIGERDYWVVKISEDGEKCWDKTLGALDVDQPMSGFEDREGNYVLAGWTDSGASGDKTEASRGSRDAWIVKIDQPVIVPPTVNTPEPYIACDKNDDGYAIFDLSSVEQDIIGDQTNLVISYFDKDGKALPSPLPAAFTNTTKQEQIISVVVSQADNTCSSVRLEITLSLDEECEKDKGGSGKGPDLSIYFPKFFSPNGDGQNDQWGVFLTQTRNFKLVQIFDRYGKLLKELAPEDTWNGEWNGVQMPVDDYWFSALTADNKVMRGHFSLLR